MQIKLTLHSIEKISAGLTTLAKMVIDKKNKVPFEFRWNIKQWLNEIETPIKNLNELRDDLLKVHGEEVFAKEFILNQITKIPTYNSDGSDKLIYWQTIIPPDKKKEYDVEIEKLNNQEIEISKVKLFKLSELIKLENEKSLDPLTPELLFALSPIIEDDSEKDEK